MADVVFVGDIVVTVVATPAGDFHAEKIMWKDVPQPNLKPVTVINTVSPVAFHQLHKWVEGEIHAKSEAIAAIHGQGTDYLPPGATAVACSPLTVAVVGHDAAAYTITFTGAMFMSEEFSHEHDGEAITIYKFVATSAALAKD